MTKVFTALREAVLAAATEALQEMQITLNFEAEKAMEDDQWDWQRRTSTGDIKIEKRDIIDTEMLMKSASVDPAARSGNLISGSIEWDPVNDFAYAALVHNGARDYFLDDPKNPDDRRDYTARPWTFLLAPKEARDESQLNTKSGPTAATMPETSWNFAMTVFQETFQANLSKSFRVR